MSEELKAIRADLDRVQKDLDDLVSDGFSLVGYGELIKMVGHSNTLLSLLTAYQARAEAAEARVGELNAQIVWAVETLQEINVSNYDHDDVCRLNDASVEVILRLCAEPATHNSKGTPDGR